MSSVGCGPSGASGSKVSAATSLDAKYLPANALFRINPKECDYKNMNVKGDFFVTRNSKVLGLVKGAKIFAVASGRNREAGLHGVWEVLEAPSYADVKEDKLNSFVEPHKQKRAGKKQVCARAKLIIDTSGRCPRSVLIAAGLNSILKQVKAVCLSPADSLRFEAVVQRAP